MLNRILSPLLIKNGSKVFFVALYMLFYSFANYYSITPLTFVFFNDYSIFYCVLCQLSYILSSLYRL